MGEVRFGVCVCVKWGDKFWCVCMCLSAEGGHGGGGGRGGLKKIW